MVAIRISECEFNGPGGRIRLRLFLELINKDSGSCQRLIKVIYSEKQQKPVPGLCPIRTVKSWMFVRTHWCKQSKTVPSESTICPKYHGQVPI